MAAVSHRPYTSPPSPRPLPPPALRLEQKPASAEARPASRQTQSASKEQPRRVELHDKDTFESVPASSQSQQQGFTSAGRSVQQRTDNGCGSAALATVNSASTRGESDEQLLGTVQDNAQHINASLAESGLQPVDLANGTNPQEMGGLLGQQGQEVVRGFGQFDSDALKNATEQGDKAMMLVNTNALENAQSPGQEKPEGEGGQHWITIDDVKEIKGADGQMEPVYSVKDSDSNKEYTLTRDQMENIVNQGKNGENQTGGGLIVKNRPDVDTQEEKDALSKANYDHVAPETLGTDDGGGRNSRLSAVSS